jgi:putative membrane protein
VITLGLFTFIVNALMLLLTSALSGGRLIVDGFWPALLGGVVIGIVSMLLSLFLGEGE